jgi:quercetin dioxygenase-like cupin family protein
MEICKKLDDMAWRPHPLVKEVSVKPLVTKGEDGLDVTCMLVRIPPGSDIPEHVHEEQADILYPLQGRAQMQVEGQGTFDLEPGMIVRVPKNTKHRIFDVTEELLIYDVFQPATF